MNRELGFKEYESNEVHCRTEKSLLPNPLLIQKHNMDWENIPLLDEDKNWRSRLVKAVADPEAILRDFHLGPEMFFDNHAFYIGAKRRATPLLILFNSRESAKKKPLSTLKS